MFTTIIDPAMDIAVQKTHCDWIGMQAKMIKAMLDYNVHHTPSNKVRALSALSTMQDSINEMKSYFESFNKSEV